MSLDSRESASKAAMPAWIFCDCREGKSPTPWSGFAKEKLGHAPLFATGHLTFFIFSLHVLTPYHIRHYHS